MRLHFIKICISHVSLIKLQRRLIRFNFQFCEGVYDRYDTLHNIGIWTALVCQYCKLGQLDEVARLLCDVIKLCFSPPITDNGFLNGNIGEENLSAVDRSEKIQVNSETVLEEIWTDGNHEVLLKLW